MLVSMDTPLDSIILQLPLSYPRKMFVNAFPRNGSTCHIIFNITIINRVENYGHMYVGATENFVWLVIPQFARRILFWVTAAQLGTCDTEDMANHGHTQKGVTTKRLISFLNSTPSPNTVIRFLVCLCSERLEGLNLGRRAEGGGTEDFQCSYSALQVEILLLLNGHQLLLLFVGTAIQLKQ
jgi:hypothetical protein